MIRTIKASDINQVAGLIADFYAESDYNAPLINPDKTRMVLQAYIDNVQNEDLFCQVIDMNNEIGGIMIGERLPDLWSDTPRVCEIMMYVKPLYRGRPSAGRLLLNFADWAKEKPAMIRVEAGSGIATSNATQVFTKLGWGHRGTLHGTEVH